MAPSRVIRGPDRQVLATASVTLRHFLGQLSWPTPRSLKGSAQSPKSRRGTTLHGPVSVGRGRGVRPGEKFPCLPGVAWSLALDEHLSPQEVCPGSEELGSHPVVHRSGLGEVAVRLVEVAEDGGEAAEIVTDRALSRCTAGCGQLIGPRNESVEQRPGVLRFPAVDRGVGVADHSGEPKGVQGEIEVCDCELRQQLTCVTVSYTH